MKIAITCIQVQLEVTPFNDEGKAMSRPRVEPLMFAEASIPDEVLAWLHKQIPQRVLEALNAPQA